MESSNPKQSYVECSEITTRLILRAGDLSPDGKVRETAFLLRPHDCGRLSVFRSARGSLDDYKSKFNKVHGSCTLHTGNVRQIGVSAKIELDVVPDEKEFLVGHAAIVGIPDREVDLEAAEYIAGRLRDHCR